MPRAVILRAPAKINLTLRVGPRLPDGYHDVRTVMQTVSLFDTLTITPRRGPFALHTRTPGVPADETNLVWRAADLLWRSAGRDGPPRDAHVRLTKTIPAAAGLGGGSADAAAALAGLNRVWDLRRSARDLMELASRLGADVPFFLVGGTALGTGRGDELYPLEDVGALGVVIIKPSFGVSTADAYRWCDEDRADRTTIEAPSRRPVDLGWPTGPVALVNDLEGPVARRHAAIREIVDLCYREGATAAAMTGSGSAVFGLFSEASAGRAARQIRRPDWLVLVTRTLGRREARRRMTL